MKKGKVFFSSTTIATQFCIMSQLVGEIKTGFFCMRYADPLKTCLTTNLIWKLSSPCPSFNLRVRRIVLMMI